MENFVQPSFQMLLISLALFIIMLVIARPSHALTNLSLCAQRTSNWTFDVFFITYALYVIFAFNSSDFFSYWNKFLYAGQFGYYKFDSYEFVYNWFADFTGNYLVWRSVIWGMATFFLYLTALKLNLKNTLLFLAMVLFGLGLNVYSRGILGHAVLLYGAILLVDNYTNILIKILGLIFILVSYYLHNSMFVNIIFVILAFYPLGKKSLLLSVVAFPFLITVVTIIMNGIVAGTLDISYGESAGDLDRAEYYASKENREFTIYGLIPLIISTISEYFVLFYIIKKVLYDRIFEGIRREKLYTYLFRLVYVTIYIASLFAFVETSSWIYSRFKYMAFFPLPFLLAKIWSLERSSRFAKCVISFQLFAIGVNWLATLFSWYKNF